MEVTPRSNLSIKRLATWLGFSLMILIMLHGLTGCARLRDCMSGAGC